MSNVFMSELDSFFLDKIQLTVTDSEGVPFMVPVTYHQPEGEGVPDFSGSLVSFFMYDLMLDEERLQSDFDIVVSRDDTNNTVTTKKVPIPYKLFYQFDLWSEWQEDIIEMQKQWLLSYPPRTNIAVPSDDGIEHDLFMALNGYKNGDGRLWDDGQKRTDIRLFRRIYRYCIHTELDDGQVQQYKQVLEIDPNTESR